MKKVKGIFAKEISGFLRGSNQKRVFDYLLEKGRPLPVATLCVRLDLQLVMCHKLLNILVDRGFLIKAKNQFDIFVFSVNFDEVD